MQNNDFVSADATLIVLVSEKSLRMVLGHSPAALEVRQKMYMVRLGDVSET